MVSNQSLLWQRMSTLAIGVLVGISALQALPLPPGNFSRGKSAIAYAQTLNHPFNGQSVVYVSKNSEWHEAFIRQISGRTAPAQTVWLYTVQYLDGAREVETNVSPERMRSIEQAQAQGLTTNVYDLSNPAGINQMLAAHNSIRQQVGVSDLRWSADLARSAQEWANYLLKENRFEHSSADFRKNGTIGENLTSRHSSTSGGSYTTPTRAIEGWVNERNYYHYPSNSCDPGQTCGHYTQMIWAKTTEVGCAMARTPDAKREVWACHYNPTGNIVGQRPY